ncbi:TonB-dependent receptor [Rugamonas sp.]|uniref:TonB-dependent receptor n=1 Tax=Rugamonas sp. TaxID=1926287 RepID=UPI0025FB70DC|nr:TonB-dependent receptor [Rugamonas sp.]
MKHIAHQRGISTPRTYIAFKLNPVAASCAMLLAALAASAPLSADAQEAAVAASAAEPVVQSVTVSGIRRGIEAAIAVKKDATSIVEAISAEDIGKLPDTSIAESIAALPGLTAQYVGGHANLISIRGFSPDLGGTLLNGRELASTGDSRTISYDDFPSELMAGVVVYKTPDAGLVAQGLSGTVDMQTIDPLAFASRVITVNGRKEHDGTGPQRGSGSRTSLSYVDQFFDRKVGVAIGFARTSDKSGAIQSFNSWGSGTTSYNGRNVTIPYSGFNAETDITTERRDGAMAVLEFRPNKDFTSTVDIFYSKYDQTKAERLIQASLNNTNSNTYDLPTYLSNAVVDGNGNVLSGTINNVRAVVRTEPIIYNDKVNSIGWKNIWTLSPDWKLLGDISHSKATRIENDQEIYAGTVGLAGQPGVLGSIGFAAGSHNLTSSINYADPSIIKIVDSQGWGGGPDVPQAGYDKGPHVTDKVDALRLGATYTLPENRWFSSLDFGANYTKRSKTRVDNEYLLQVPGGPYAALAEPGGYSASAGDSGLNMLTFNAVGVIPGLYYNQKFHSDIYNKNWIVDERVSTGMAKLNIDSELAAVPVKGNLGLQVVHASQSSGAYAADIDGSLFNSPVIPISTGASYYKVLPSLNLVGDFGNQNFLRFALAREMQRPNMIDMRASTAFSVNNAQGGIYSGSGGNPTLKPWVADGVDLSFEKYFGTKGYFSAAAFFKRLDTYVVNYTNFSYDFTSAIQPGTPKAPSNIGYFTEPTNGAGGRLYGIELSASMPFELLWKPLDGFGAQASFSLTNSSIAVPDNIPGQSAASMTLPGLSKQVASAAFYYEKYGFQARIADTYRSDSVGTIEGFGGDLGYAQIKANLHLSAQVQYEFQGGPAKGLTLLVQGNNLADAPEIHYVGTRSNETQHTTYGRTLYFGINYKM